MLVDQRYGVLGREIALAAIVQRDQFDFLAADATFSVEWIEICVDSGDDRFAVFGSAAGKINSLAKGIYKTGKERP